MVVIKAPTLSGPKISLARSNSGNCKFMTVSAGSWAVLVVQIGGTVEGRREQDVVRLAKVENGIVQRAPDLTR